MSVGDLPDFEGTGRLLGLGGHPEAGDNRQSGHTGSGEQGSTPGGALDIGEPNAPGYFHDRIYLSAILAPPSAQHHVSLQDVVCLIL